MGLAAFLQGDMLGGANTVKQIAQTTALVLLQLLIALCEQMVQVSTMSELQSWPLTLGNIGGGLDHNRFLTRSADIFWTQDHLIRGGG